MNRRFRAAVAVPLFIAALTLLSYPFAANYLFEHRTDSLVSVIEQAMAEEEAYTEWSAALEQAAAYNRVLAGGHIELKDPFVEEGTDGAVDEYGSLLCMTGDGVMGFVEIPSIDVSLPIYHGTSQQTLELGVGHLQGTSLPVGGQSTHAVLTGHSGLSTAKLFTDLTELETEDVFFLNVMGKRLAYRVDRITAVLPEDLSGLCIESGKDYCTLITCTPYGVNTHRLLVRGERTDYQEAVSDPESFQEHETGSVWMAEYRRALRISGVGFAAGLALLWLKRRLGIRASAGSK